MEKILKNIDFETQSVYKVLINIYENDVYNNTKEGEVDADGQSLDIVSDLRRTIKYSYPSDKKKIIKSIVPHDEKEDEHGNKCRDIDLEYYLVDEENEEFSIEELQDELKEEWYVGSANIEVAISLYEEEAS